MALGNQGLLSKFMPIKKNQRIGDRADVTVVQSKCRYVFYQKDNGGLQIAVSSPSPEVEGQVDLHNAISAHKFHIQPELVFEFDSIEDFGRLASHFWETYQEMSQQAITSKFEA